MSDNVHLVCPQCGAVNRLPAAKLGQDPKCGQCQSQLTPGQPVHLTGHNFQKNLTRNDVPLVIDFWAPWCGPCKMMAPAFEEAAHHLGPAVRLAKVDTQAEPELGGRYGIQSIPTMVIFKGGRELARTSGAMNAQSIVSWVKANT